MENCKERVLLVGMGLIGSAWARHYENAGVLWGTWNRSPREGMLRPCRLDAETVASASVLHLVVADPPAVRSLLTMVAPWLTSGHLVVQSSTIDPASSEEFSQLVRHRGAGYVEAPFTGSKPAAEAGKVVFYLGGEPSEIKRARVFLDLLSSHGFHIGSGAQAAALKLAMNLQIAIQAQALCESFHLARAAGIPADLYFEVLARNVAHSGLTDLKKPKLLAGDYSPQFSIKHMHKDLRLAEATADGSYPLLEKIRAIFTEAEQAGLGDKDFISLFQRLES